MIVEALAALVVVLTVHGSFRVVKMAKGIQLLVKEEKKSAE